MAELGLLADEDASEAPVTVAPACPPAPVTSDTVEELAETETSLADDS